MHQDKPIIIPRASHPISRGMLSPNALRVLYRLRENGFIAYLVGGCVRDLLLGREPKDFDVVTDATPGQIKRLFRNCRLVGRRFRLAHLHFADEIIEVSTFRSTLPDLSGTEEPPVTPEESSRPPRHLKNEEGMVLRDNLFGTPQQDALRRDFTVNALAYSIADFSIIDHAGGMEDLQRGVVRTIGDPRVRFTEDPVRMLRAVRFAAILGFTFEAETWEAIIGQSRSVALASPPRLYEEMLKLFLSGEGEKCYQLLRRTGLFAALFPFFSDWLERETDGFPHTRVGEALDRIDGRIQAGEKVTPQLLLTLMFGQYLEEKSGKFKAGGAQPQQSTDLAVAEFFQEQLPTVQIPHKVGLMVRSILGMQNRFRKIPGSRPLSFVKRPGFKEALDYLRFSSEITGENAELYLWWEKYERDNQFTMAEVSGGEEPRTSASGRRRSRRRKKKGRSPISPPSS